MNPFKILIMTMGLLFVSDTPTTGQHPDVDQSEKQPELYKPINLDPDPNHAFDAWQSVIQEAKTKTSETDKKD